MRTNKRYKLGIDIGGTFTDFSLYDDYDNSVYDFKVRTDKDNYADGIIKGINKYKELGIDLTKISFIIHGITIGLNTILQRNGSKLGLLVTDGFRDILNIQRLRLPVPYDFNSKLPTPLIERSNVLPVTERIDVSGKELKQVDYTDVDRAISNFSSKGIHNIVISFIHSYLYPEHEKQVKSYINNKYPEFIVDITSDLNKSIGEYERTILSVLNLYIKDSVSNYLNTLNQKINDNGINVTPLLTKSNSGITSIEDAVEQPVRTLLSGPAAGILGASRINNKNRDLNAITVDVGGTSADISIIKNGKVVLTEDNKLNGFPIIDPSVLLYSIGSGGGSYAWIDRGGILKVGPRSSGSYPGPAAYGTGTEPTVTDAFVQLNYLNPDSFAGGSIKLYPEKSQKALSKISEVVNKSIDEVSNDIIKVIVANMTTEISNVLSQQGIDNKDFSLISYGGAGPLFANYLADELSLKDIIFPLSPGTLCAYGSLFADYLFNDSTVFVSKLNDLNEKLYVEYKRLLDKGNEWLNKQSNDQINSVEVSYLINARYSGQTLELPIIIDSLEDSLDKISAKLKNDFDDKYLKTYQHNSPEKDIEVTKLSIQLRGKLSNPILKNDHINKNSETIVANSTRKILLDNKQVDVPVYKRNQFNFGSHIVGPALIDQNDTTILILPKWGVNVDDQFNLIVSRE